MLRLPAPYGSPACRALVRAILLAVAVAASHPSDLPAAEVAAGKKKEEKPKVTLTPEKEAKLALVLKMAGEANRKFWVERMKREIERVTKVTGLDADGAKALGDAAGRASDACLDGLISTLGEAWRPYFSTQEDAALEVDQLVAQLDQSARMGWHGDFVRPYEHALWEEGLRRALSADQTTAWKNSEKERAEAVTKEAAAALKAVVDQACEQQRRLLYAKGAAIKAGLALSKERGAKLDALADTVAAAAADRVRQRAEKMLQGMEDDQRKSLLKTGRFHLGLEEKELEVQQAAWTKGLAEIVSAEEAKRLDATREGFNARRVVVLGQILLTQFDERVAFTASQRERLRPIAERLVKDEKLLFPDPDQGNSYRIDLQTLLAAGKRATKEELSAILDDVQRQRWQEACWAQTIRRIRVVAPAKKTEPAAAVKSPFAAPEPEFLEHALSDFLDQKTASERKRLLAGNLLKAEDAGRVADLSPEARARLETAARGATEATLVAWKSTTESSVRSQVRDATPESVKQLLAGMDTYSYSRSSSSKVSSPIWESAVKAEISEAGRAAWNQELDARTAYRDNAIAAMIMSEFDRRFPLTPDQWTQLEPLIAKAVKDYAPDILSMFSSTTPWYLQSYSMFIPFAAVAEKELKPLLGKEAWERWVGSEEYGSTNNYWENVQRNHAQRTKEKKE